MTLLSRLMLSRTARAVISGVIISVLILLVSATCLVGAFILPIKVLEMRHLALTPKDRLDAEATLRLSLIQLVGGLVVFVGLYFTARTVRLTGEGQTNDRFAKAIEQLGNHNLDVRIGAIYALERLARDSRVDGATIIEVLTAFVREHTRDGPQRPCSAPVSADVQAAISVLARRRHVNDETTRLDFYFSGLTDANFRHGDFRGAMFYYSILDHASFAGANVDGAGGLTPAGARHPISEMIARKVSDAKAAATTADAGCRTGEVRALDGAT